MSIQTEMTECSISSVVSLIQREREQYTFFNAPGASDAAIAETSRLFEQEFGSPLPEAYQHLLRDSDGLMDNGLTIWPCAPHWKFLESIVTANHKFRGNVSDDFLYFGQRDDSVFVMEPATGRYIALEISNLSEWEEFPDCESMIVFMLERALG